MGDRPDKGDLGMVSPGDLVPWADNPRHNSEAIQKVAASIKRYGFGAPIVARPCDGRVIAGHTRLAAAHLLGLAQVPVRWLALGDAEAAALALADNRIGEAARWDDVKLASVLSELDAEGISGDEMGWSDGELQEVIQAALATTRVSAHERALGTQDPGAQEAPGEPQSRVGEVYLLGPHRLVCGDSGDPEHWDGVKADAVWTDPPYGVSVLGGGRWRSEATRRSVGYTGIEGDALTGEDLRGLLRRSLGLAYEHTAEGGVWYVSAPSGDHLLDFLVVLSELPGTCRHCLVWAKGSFVLGLADYHSRHEMVLYGWKPGAAHAWTGGRSLDSLLQYPRPAPSGKDHPTQKPLELVRDTLSRHVQPGQVVVDPFGGSGTTLIAAAQLGCAAMLWECDPRYADVIRKRWGAWAKDAGQPIGDGLGE